MDLAKVRLGFVGGRPMYCDGQVWVERSLGRLIESLQSKTSAITVALSHAPARPLHSVPLEVSNDCIVPLPSMPTTARGFFKVRSCLAAIREVERRSDVVIVQLPFQAGLALVGAKRPRVYQTCADVVAIVATSKYYRGATRAAALTVAHVQDSIQSYVIHQSEARHVAHGEDLWKRYGEGHGRAIVSSTLMPSEVRSVTRQRPADAPFRVLFVGQLRHEKGIDILLQAFRQVATEIPRAELHIVGPAVASYGTVAKEIMHQLASLGMDRVSMLGAVPFGPELFRCFADADVLVVPSRSEGTPRVLIEARAFRCPVIGSRVGGIPSSIADEVDGLLVPPNNAAALASAIVRIATDAELAERLKVNGVAKAYANTIESTADALLAEADVLLNRLQIVDQFGAKAVVRSRQS